MRISKSLTVSTNIETSEVTLSFIDENEVSQDITVPPQAADVLVLGLLASPPLRRSDGKTSPQRNPFVAQGSSSGLSDNGLFYLSFRLTNDSSVSIAFPREAIPTLQSQLARMLEGPPPTAH